MPHSYPLSVDHAHHHAADSPPASPVLAALNMDDPAFRRQFHHVVKHLFTHGERLLLTLHYADGLTFAEIAALLGQPKDQLLAQHETLLAIVRMVLARHDINFSPNALRRLITLLRQDHASPRPPRRLPTPPADATDASDQLTMNIARFRIARVLRDLNLCHPDQALFLIATPILHIAADRIEQELDNPASPLSRLSRKMDALLRDYQLPDHLFWTLDEAPQTYRDLNHQWQQHVRSLTASVFRDFGEPQLADLYATDPPEFNRRLLSGRSHPTPPVSRCPAEAQTPFPIFPFLLP
jgi:hypothetical protein